MTETVAEFLARGGVIQIIPTGLTKDSVEKCDCGCNGHPLRHWRNHEDIAEEKKIRNAERAKRNRRKNEDRR